MLEHVSSLEEMRALALDLSSPTAREVVERTASNRDTVAANVQAFERLRIHGRVLRGLASVDTTTELLDYRLAHPIMLAPTAYNRIFSEGGEVDVAAAAASTGSSYVLSEYSSVPMEHVAPLLAQGPPWFVNLVVHEDRGFTLDKVRKAQDHGAHGFVVTADMPVKPQGSAVAAVGQSLPNGVVRAELIDFVPTPGQRQRVAAKSYHYQTFNPLQSWSDVQWLVESTNLPVIVKGITHPADAKIAADVGCRGIVVSNHGGRALASRPTTASVLPRIANEVGGELSIVVDSGIRTGESVLKALALGASAVMVGRPYIYGLLCGGRSGVEKVVNLLLCELEAAMHLAGVPSLSSHDLPEVFDDRA